MKKNVMAVWLPFIPVLFIIISMAWIIPHSEPFKYDKKGAEQRTEEISTRLDTPYDDDVWWKSINHMPHGIGSDEHLAILDRILSKLDTSAAKDSLGAFNPSGDELFDHFVTHWDPDEESYRKLYLISETEFAKFEEQFGNDPRFWELRYFIAMDNFHAQPKRKVEFLDGMSTPVDILYKALDQDTVSANTILLIYLDYMLNAQSIMDELSQYNKLVLENRQEGMRVPDRPEFNEELEAAEVLKQEINETRLDLLNQAIALTTDEAWPYYFRGLYFIEIGETELGLKDIAVGNNQLKIDYPLPYPVSDVAHSIIDGTPMGGANLAGSFMFSEFQQPKPILDLENDLDEALLDITDGNEADSLNTLYEFACRYPSAKPYDSTFASTGVSLIEKLKDYAKSLEMDTPASGGANPLILIGLATAIAGDRLEEITPATSESETFKFVMNLTKGNALGVGFFLEVEAEARALETEVQPIFDDLAKISWPIEEEPEFLLKYQNVDLASVETTK